MSLMLVFGLTSILLQLELTGPVLAPEVLIPPQRLLSLPLVWRYPQQPHVKAGALVLAVHPLAEQVRQVLILVLLIITMNQLLATAHPGILITTGLNGEQFD